MPLRLMRARYRAVRTPGRLRPAVPLRRGGGRGGDAGVRAGGDRGRRQRAVDRRRRRTAGAEMVRQAAAAVVRRRPSTSCGVRLRSRASSISRTEASTAPSACTRNMIAAQVAACAKEDIPPLAAAFGPAEIDKADSRCAAALRRRRTFFDGMAGNIAGIDARLSPDLADDDIARFLAARQRTERVAVRHTVGLTTRIEGRGRRRRSQREFRRALFQAQARRRSRRGCRAADPDRQRTRDACPMTTASRSTPTSNMPISRR